MRLAGEVQRVSKALCEMPRFGVSVRTPLQHQRSCQRPVQSGAKRHCSLVRDEIARHNVIDM